MGASRERAQAALGMPSSEFVLRVRTFVSRRDFGEVRVHCRNRTEEIVHLFASRLKDSPWADVTLAAVERSEAWCSRSSISSPALAASH